MIVHDPAASFTRFVETNGGELQRAATGIAFRLGLPRSLGEDIFSEALTRAWKDWTRIDKGHRTGWVYLTMCNIALKHYRDKRRDQTRFGE